MALLKIVSGEKPREIAVQVLGRRGREQFTEDLLDQILAGANLPPVDRRLSQELVYGIVRWQATLDWLIDRKTRGRSQKPALRDLLHLGLYQIFWLARIPNHAAVHVTVELAKHRGFGPQAGFVNALLRGYLREFGATRALLDELKTTHPHLGYSHPEWLVDRWQKRWGQARTAELLSWNNTPPKTFARVNTLKIDAAKLLPIWREEDVEYDFVRHDWFEENLVFELKSHPPLNRLPSFQRGFFYIQDPSTLLAVHSLDPRPGQTVLDLCAAPGGKLTCIAQVMGNQGRIVARDLDPHRIKLIEDNCARLGVTSVEVSPGSAGASPATGARPSGRFNEVTEKALEENPDTPLGTPQERREHRAPILPDQKFDRILVDAPCSNTGVMRRRVDLRWRLSPQEIERLRKMQLELLRTAAPQLQPGGMLVYSTCSLEPEENRKLIDEFLACYTNFELQSEQELLPFTQQVDGAYVVKLTLKG
jgi:16S rRNA (cytosine967-C5)-methyltransferase